MANAPSLRDALADFVRWVDERRGARPDSPCPCCGVRASEGRCMHYCPASKALAALAQPAFEEPPAASLDAYEGACLRHAMDESAGDALRAARTLCVSRSTIYRLLAKHSIGSSRKSRTSNQSEVAP